jgi:hypothetical protein
LKEGKMKVYKKIIGLISLVLLFFLGPIPRAVCTVSYSDSFSASDLSFGTENGYDVVELKGCVSMTEVGKPRLPVKYVNLIIPTATDVESISITSWDSTIVEGSYYIIPAQYPTCTCECDTTPPSFVEPDSATYNSSSPYPGKLAECVTVGYFDGKNRIATIALYPLQFVPVDSQLILYTEIALELHTTSSSDQGYTVQFRAKHIFKKSTIMFSNSWWRTTSISLPIHIPRT